MLLSGSSNSIIVSGTSKGYKNSGFEFGFEIDGFLQILILKDSAVLLVKKIHGVPDVFICNFRVVV